jgi:flavodoxin I
MEKVGVFYSFSSNKTARLGEKIIITFGSELVEKVNAENVTVEEFLRYKNYIVGVPTWFDGELPLYWDEFVPAIKDMDLKGRKFAIYGLGDQKGYPENFNDGVGLFVELVTAQGADIVGYTAIDGYEFEGSIAVKNGMFCGLCLDQENQAKLSDKRIANWVEQLKKEFL